MATIDRDKRQLFGAINKRERW